MKNKFNSFDRKKWLPSPAAAAGSNPGSSQGSGQKQPYRSFYSKKRPDNSPDFPELVGPTFEPEFKQTRQPQAGDFQSLIQVVANRFGLGPTLRAIQICQAARHLFEEYFPDLHASFEPQSYKNNTLIILSRSPSHSLLLVSKKHLILERLNQQFGSNTCTEIKIRLQAGS